MRFLMRVTAMAGCLLAVSPRAETLEIPYAGGKLYGTFTVTLDNGTSISPDTVRIGSALTIIPYLAYSLIAVCNNRNELGFQLLPAGDGSVLRRPNGDTNWMSYDFYPVAVSSMVSADSVPVLTPAEPPDLSKARGYVFARPGDWICETETYEFDTDYRQILFPAGDGFYAKLQIFAFTQTLPGPPPPQYQPTILNTVSVRYVINDDPEDLADESVSLRPARPRYGKAGEGAVNHVNPLGIRVHPAAARPVPALPVPRARPVEPSGR